MATASAFLSDTLGFFFSDKLSFLYIPSIFSGKFWL